MLKHVEPLFLRRFSNVVLLTPEKQIYAFCLRGVEKHFPRSDAQHVGVALKNGKIVDWKGNDYRCRDKRLRYFDFPELKAIEGCCFRSCFKRLSSRLSLPGEAALLFISLFLLF